MRLFNLSNIGWSENISITLTHETKTDSDFRQDIKEVVSSLELTSQYLIDFMTVGQLIRIIGEKLIDLGYKYPIYESDISFDSEGIIDESFPDIKKIIGDESIDRIIHHNENIRYLIEKDFESHK
jgi:hypothetical protein